MDDPLFLATDKAKYLARHGATHCVYRTEAGGYAVAPGTRPPAGGVLLATYGPGQKRGRGAAWYPTRKGTP